MNVAILFACFVYVFCGNPEKNGSVPQLTKNVNAIQPERSKQQGVKPETERKHEGKKAVGGNPYVQQPKPQSPPLSQTIKMRFKSEYDKLIGPLPVRTETNPTIAERIFVQFKEAFIAQIHHKTKYELCHLANYDEMCRKAFKHRYFLVDQAIVPDRTAKARCERRTIHLLREKMKNGKQSLDLNVIACPFVKNHSPFTSSNANPGLPNFNPTLNAQNYGTNSNTMHGNQSYQNVNAHSSINRPNMPVGTQNTSTMPCKIQNSPSNHQNMPSGTQNPSINHLNMPIGTHNPSINHLNTPIGTHNPSTTIPFETQNQSIYPPNMPSGTHDPSTSYQNPFSMMYENTYQNTPYGDSNHPDIYVRIRGNVNPSTNYTLHAQNSSNSINYQNARDGNSTSANVTRITPRGNAHTNNHQTPANFYQNMQPGNQKPTNNYQNTRYGNPHPANNYQNSQFGYQNPGNIYQSTQFGNPNPANNNQNPANIYQNTQHVNTNHANNYQNMQQGNQIPGNNYQNTQHGNSINDNGNRPIGIPGGQIVKYKYISPGAGVGKIFGCMMGCSAETDNYFIFENENDQETHLIIKANIVLHRLPTGQLVSIYNDTYFFTP